MNITKQFRLKKNLVSQPTVFHITHYKSGSQWVLAVLSELAKERIEKPQGGAKHVTQYPIVPGRIYPCAYLTRQKFIESSPPSNSRVFIVIRDLRDTLVSLYFSLRNSHRIMNPGQRETRDILRSIGVNEGLLWLMKTRLNVSAQIQRTWIDTDHLLTRYEDLNRDEHSYFKRIISYCGFQFSEDKTNEAIDRHSFEKRAGRRPGEEDLNSHHRKGIVGDWRNYFDKKLTREFKDRYGNLLIKTGYEDNTKW